MRPLPLLAGEALHLAAIILLPFKLHTSRSSAGVSLKTQELYLVVFLTRYADLLIHFISLYNTVMKTLFIALTAGTIGMMRLRPSLKASYDAALMVPSPTKGEKTCRMAGQTSNMHLLEVFLWTLSQLLEPLAIGPQLLLFRKCDDVGRLPGVYVSLLAGYRGLYMLEWLLQTYDGVNLAADATLRCISGGLQIVLYMAFLVDRLTRRRSLNLPPANDTLLDDHSPMRERLLEGEELEASKDGGSEAVPPPEPPREESSQGDFAARASSQRADPPETGGERIDNEAYSYPERVVCDSSALRKPRSQSGIEIL